MAQSNAQRQSSSSSNSSSSSSSKKSSSSSSSKNKLIERINSDVQNGRINAVQGFDKLSQALTGKSEKDIYPGEDN